MHLASLFPAGTEIAFAIGAGDEVVGVSHACDYPPEVADRKVVTSPRFDATDLTSAQIYRQKVETNRKFGSLYRLDETAMWAMRAEVVITQGPSDFSLVSIPNVRAIADGLNPRPSLVILFPRHLDDVFDDFSRVGFEVGRLPAARELIARIYQRIEAVGQGLRGATRRRTVAFIQWLDPAFSGGYWIPQLIELAGGIDVFGTPGVSPSRVRWQDLRRHDPEILVVACEDMSIDRINSEMEMLTDRPGWYELAAVQGGSVFIGDGGCFTRGGPRLIDALEALAWAINPHHFEIPRPEVLRRFGD